MGPQRISPIVKRKVTSPKRASPSVKRNVASPSLRKSLTKKCKGKQVTCDIELDSDTPSPTKKCKGKQVRWDKDMSRLMIDVLLDEDAHGQKTKNGYSATTFQKVCRTINETLYMDITVENVHARYKSFTKNYREARKVERNSGFSWDSRTERVTADPLAWLDLLEKDPKLEKYRYKVVPYFDKLSIIVGDDVETGEGGATGVEADKDIPPIEDIGYSRDSSSMVRDDVEVLSADVERSSHRSTKKRKRRQKDSNDSSIDLLADVAQRMARAMEKPDMSKLQDELLKVPNITRPVFIKALNSLGCDSELTHVFLGLKDEFKEDWLKITLGLPLS